MKVSLLQSISPLFNFFFLSGGGNDCPAHIQGSLQLPHQKRAPEAPEPDSAAEEGEGRCHQTKTRRAQDAARQGGGGG